MKDNGTPLRALQHRGTGPGTFTPDGCSVELYARLPESGESAVVTAVVPLGSTVLELGAGAGRVTRALLARGLRVTAVDESAAMLAHVEDAETVHSTVEDLRLDRRFDAVLLASFLVNTADEALRAALLRTCARHVAADGCVLVQREGTWHDGLEAGASWERAGMRVCVTAREPLEEGVQRVTMEYAFEDAAWTHTFVARRLTEPDFEAALAAAGLTLDRYLTDDRSWARAVPS
jgi:SAM-dependent methyltransferase